MGRSAVLLVLLLSLVVATVCSARRTVAVACCVGDPAVVATAGDHPPDAGTHDRLLHLSLAGNDVSCLARVGGTLVARELSDQDVHRIEALIRRWDSLPIIAIRQKSFFGEPASSKGVDFEAMTGVECGGLSGHGKLFRLTRVDGEWLIKKEGSWFS
jgi:hypothetical protein